MLTPVMSSLIATVPLVAVPTLGGVDRRRHREVGDVGSTAADQRGLMAALWRSASWVRSA